MSKSKRIKHAEQLDVLAAAADEVAAAQATAGLKNDCSIQYWCGAAMAYRRAAAILRGR